MGLILITVIFTLVGLSFLKSKSAWLMIFFMIVASIFNVFHSLYEVDIWALLISSLYVLTWSITLHRAIKYQRHNFLFFTVVFTALLSGFLLVQQVSNLLGTNGTINNLYFIASLFLAMPFAGFGYFQLSTGVMIGTLVVVLGGLATAILNLKNSKKYFRKIKWIFLAIAFAALTFIGMDLYESSMILALKGHSYNGWQALQPDWETDLYIIITENEAGENILIHLEKNQFGIWQIMQTIPPSQDSFLRINWERQSKTGKITYYQIIYGENAELEVESLREALPDDAIITVDNNNVDSATWNGQIVTISSSEDFVHFETMLP